MIVKTIFIGIVTVLAASFVSESIEDSTHIGAMVKEISAPARTSEVGTFELGEGRSVNQMLNTRNTTFNY